jgi:hypothetical protein
VICTSFLSALLQQVAGKSPPASLAPDRTQHHLQMWLDGWIRSVRAGMGSSGRRHIGRDPGSPASPPHPSPPSPPRCRPCPREPCWSSLRGARSYIALPTLLLMLRWPRPAVRMLQSPPTAHPADRCEVLAPAGCRQVLAQMQWRREGIHF